VPFDYSDGDRIAQGIERNAWGKPVRYFVYKQSPNALYRLPTLSDLKPIGFDSIYHLATFDHVGQLRGVSEFASVITRLEDIKDYEESERVAAKIAAMLTAYVKKGTPDLYQPPESTTPNSPRSLSFAPGMIIDDLAIGEEIGLIDSKRPNPNVLPFRQGQLRATAAGLGASYSSISRDYGGTYSAQRQELVEQWINYATLTDEFVGMLLEPVWEDFVTASALSGVLPIPKDVVPGSATDAIYVAQAMPWIDPLKEALGAEALVKAGFASEVEMIRRRGANPRDVLEQIEAYRKLARDKGLTFTTMVPQQVTEPPAEDKQD
jgi:lambda family phage portal protein